MRTAVIRLGLLALLAAGCGADGAPRYSGEPADEVTEALERFGACTLCHEETAVSMIATDGHGSLDLVCENCHADLTPGDFGEGHRSIPVCASCHTEPQTHHDPEVGEDGECTQCHTPHGSANLRLVNEIISTPANGNRPVEFSNRNGRADGSYASASQPGTGVCEICHTTTSFYRSDGAGQEHFTETCVNCHEHEKGFAVSISGDDCQVCHDEIVTQMDATGGHGQVGANCQACHQDLAPGDFGDGHRSVPVCASCHTEPQTHHDPEVGEDGECTQCHTPHGSANLRLVNEIISTPANGNRPVEFNNRDGRADGSYASASQPGTGVCEICHTTTSFYRSDGAGEEHFTETCVNCHGHEEGFAVSISGDDCQVCHGEIVDQMDTTGGHGVLASNCKACHQNLQPGEFGDGHRSVPVCASCHTEPQTHHDPEVDEDGECTQCHTPHGSANLRLVNEIISTPAGGDRPVEFSNRNGRADGSYASASQPGTGVCEICHTATSFYRSDGTAAGHFTETCVNCHGHEKGFAVSISGDDCQVCHGEIVTQMDTTGGHGRLASNCKACHQNLLPGEFGDGHRSVPVCAMCHVQEQTHHDPEVDEDGECTQCHTPHGSANLRLVNEIISTPANGNRPVDFNNRDGLADGSYASVSQPGTGVCEICHTSTSFYRSDGTGTGHFTSTCVDCHGHEKGFAVSVPADDCQVCHSAIAAQMDTTGGHGQMGANCQACHQDLAPGEFGDGHRSVPVCASCHTEPQTHHDPNVGEDGECTQCHTPHGSANLRLVNEIISTPANGNRPVEFNSRDGRADGSYASTSQPGTGVCEICHTSTSFYRSDGTGAGHFTSTCVDCHGHEKGFAVSISGDDCQVCHGAIATQMDTTGGHGVLASNCKACHQDLQPGSFGEGHRSVPACATCHTEEQAHHDVEDSECTQCHTPHGSPNLRLVNQIISTPGNGNRPVVFTSRTGLADGSFASASQPGTGVCEICHSDTEFYRADGTSEEKHFETTCTACHTHERGFAEP